MTGKQEFTKFINYINEIKLGMPEYIKTNLGELINKWNKRNKTIDDYFNMKENHTWLNELFNLGDEGTKKEDKSWLDYINKTMDYRVKNMNFNHSNILNDEE